MKRIYTFAAALLFLGACTSDGYTIRGNVEGLESPYVYLITFNGTHNVADSAKVEAGAFTFTGKITPNAYTVSYRYIFDSDHNEAAEAELRALL